MNLASSHHSWKDSAITTLKWTLVEMPKEICDNDMPWTNSWLTSALTLPLWLMMINLPLICSGHPWFVECYWLLCSDLCTCSGSCCVGLAPRSATSGCPWCWLSAEGGASGRRRTGSTNWREETGKDDAVKGLDISETKKQMSMLTHFEGLDNVTWKSSKTIMQTLSCLNDSLPKKRNKYLEYENLRH